MEKQMFQMPMKMITQTCNSDRHVVISYETANKLEH